MNSMKFNLDVSFLMRICSQLENGVDFEHRNANKKS